MNPIAINNVERIFSEQPQPARFARGYLDYLTKVLAQLDENEIAAFMDTLVSARERGARIFFIGNGGSAATASHFANDIAIGCRTWERPFRAMSLTDNVAIMTAIANDYGYEHIFTLQLKTVMHPGDVVVAISASGNSPNVVQAVEWANEHGATTVALTGFDGGRLRAAATQAIHVPTMKGEYGPVEDVHMIIDHLVGAFLMNHCRTEAGVSA
jgi:D-sedoheptulose 7-phosphate isomerase